MTQTVFASRLNALRHEMANAGVAAYLIPRADEFLGEYVPESARRLAWLTGFTGSAGVALILKDRAVVFSDSRYTLQLKQQVDATLFETADSAVPGLTGWIKDQGLKGIAIGFDPALHPVAEISRFEKALVDQGGSLVPVPGNLVDRIWADRPAPPRTSVEPFLESFAGLSSAQKRERIADSLTQDGIAAAVLPDPADMAWLLNIRGRDVPHAPFALSMGIIHADASVDWVIDPLRISPEIQRALGNAVRIVPPEGLTELIMRLKANIGREPVLLDERLTPYRLAQMLEDRNIVVKLGKDPCVLPRACKTKEEQNAMRDAHRKDAVAMIRFLRWLDEEWPKDKLTEVSIADRLKAFRAQDPAWRDTSFDTIAGMGPNGAIVHYRAEPETARRIRPDSLLLLDSGAQYAGGTTDITRTIAIGDPTDMMRRHYTAVLKAHIAMADAVFPRGTTGSYIDSVARAPLWKAGIDFSHRIGHGVGCYLSVHEEAVNLSAKGMDPILPGMIVSNEPGYYREGEYGIRLENVVLCVPVDRTLSDDRPLYGFETLTLVPFDPNLTRLSLLSAEEKEWLATYHTRILETIGPMLETADRRWLEAVVRFFC